ncbi:MAG: hypothetical protein J4F35_06595 [Candidatus Latescibacteria bacterium]|nr:hypothetical protein [Candidatus Latescibacterota bacterium]
MLLLVFLAGYTAAGDAQEIDDAVEINPLDYVPLEVGNRWTYEHVYLNDVDSLRYTENIVTIEITHTEVIDGFEYFVFSEADYAWPPFPPLFWGGKKVRLSDEGVLMFSWDEQTLRFFGLSDEAIAEAALSWDKLGIPLYNFGSPSGYTGYKLTQARLSRVSFDFFDIPSFSRARSFSRAGVVFLQGYGVGLVYVERTSIGLCEGAADLFLNELTPISAVISGRETVHEQVRPFYFSYQSTGIGQVAQVRMGEGFDFSQGTHSEPSNDFELLNDIEDPLGFYGSPSGKLACSPPPDFPPVLRSSETGVVDLGKKDFRMLISQGIPPDRPLDFATEWWVLYEGHTYAVRSREGGVALLYVFDAEFNEADYKPTSFPPRLEHITFDWVYYPDGLLDADTSVQPTSWGQLKNSVLRTK